MTQTPYFDEYLRNKKINDLIQVGSLWKMTTGAKEIIKLIRIVKNSSYANLYFNYLDKPRYEWEWTIVYFRFLIETKTVVPLDSED